MNTTRIYNSHKQSNSGFSLVELLVVLAIISLLASIMIGSMNTARERGRAAKIINDVLSIRDALQFRYSEVTQYPTEEELRAEYDGLPEGVMSIQNMIDEGVFNGKFAGAPSPGVGTDVYYYDADNSDGITPYPIESCNSFTNVAYGVNIIILDAIGTDPNVINELDDLVDSGDGLDCGRIRRSSAVSNIILYNISVIPSIFP